MANQTLKQKFKFFKKQVRKDIFLKKLIDVYSNPLLDKHQLFEYVPEQIRQQYLDKINLRFNQDQQVILSKMMHCLQIQPDLSNFPQALQEALYTPEEISILTRAISWVATGHEPSGNLKGDLTTLLNDSPLSIQADQAAAQADFQQTRRQLIRLILEQVIEEGVVPRFNDYDYLDDIVPIIRSRYIGQDGAYNSYQSERFLHVLWLLTGQTSVTSFEQALPTALKAVIGPGHPYVPTRAQVSPNANDIAADLIPEWSELKAEQNPERFLEINKEYSLRRTQISGGYAIRDLSIIRGYETDHHLLLRTLVRLIDEEKINREDEALIIGPRYIDEILFFRKYLGLKNTIGLDLYDEGNGMIVSGDMHAMPFQDNQFRLVYTCATLPYSYYVRKVIDEIARVLKDPGYVFIMESAGRIPGPDPLARSDMGNIETALSLFYKYPNKVIAQDPGKSTAPQDYKEWPCFALELHKNVKAL
ncbi:MAG: class I SAM-dependent methyltransferase [Cyanobacteria bacterium]|nr:class I SAM-dependent methyltransferase [Cyanobacteriota bacterium]